MKALLLRLRRAGRLLVNYPQFRPDSPAWPWKAQVLAWRKLAPKGDIRLVEVITGVPRRRYWSAHEKLRGIEESLTPGEFVSALAGRNGVAPNLLFPQRHLMNGGSAMALAWNDPVVGASLATRRWTTRSCGRLRPGRRKKAGLAFVVVTEGRFPISRAAEVLGLSHSHLHVRVAERSTPRGPYSESSDIELLPALRRLVDARPTYGYRNISSLLDRERHTSGLEPVNRERVLRMLGQYGLTLERRNGRREGRTHVGKGHH